MLGHGALEATRLGAGGTDTSYFEEQVTQDIHEYEEVEPGASWSAAHWLTERRVSLVGADNWAFEVIPFERENGIFAVHQHLLAETGTHILENIKTQELADGGHSEFLFCLTVQNSKGSTGAMASPVAVV